MGLSPAVPFSPPLLFSASSRSGGTPCRLAACVVAALRTGVRTWRAVSECSCGAVRPWVFGSASRLWRDRSGLVVPGPGVVCRLLSCAAARGFSATLRRASAGAVFVSRCSVFRSRLRSRCHTCRARRVSSRPGLLSLQVLLDATSGRVICSTPTRRVESDGGCIVALAAWCSSAVTYGPGVRRGCRCSARRRSDRAVLLDAEERLVASRPLYASVRVRRSTALLRSPRACSRVRVLTVRSGALGAPFRDRCAGDVPRLLSLALRRRVRLLYGRAVVAFAAVQRDMSRDF